MWQQELSPLSEGWEEGMMGIVHLWALLVVSSFVVAESQKPAFSFNIAIALFVLLSVIVNILSGVPNITQETHWTVVLCTYSYHPVHSFQPDHLQFLCVLFSFPGRGDSGQHPPGLYQPPGSCWVEPLGGSNRKSTNGRRIVWGFLL